MSFDMKLQVCVNGKSYVPSARDKGNDSIWQVGAACTTYWGMLALIRYPPMGQVELVSEYLACVLVWGIGFSFGLDNNNTSLMWAITKELYYYHFPRLYSKGHPPCINYNHMNEEELYGRCPLQRAPKGFFIKAFINPVTKKTIYTVHLLIFSLGVCVCWDKVSQCSQGWLENHNLPQPLRLQRLQACRPCSTSWFLSTEFIL